jgi:GNAT superfamily N-acetyltransferase
MEIQKFFLFFFQNTGIWDEIMNEIITYLEMTERSQLRPRHTGDPRFRVLEATVKQWQYNRFLYCLVGNDWTWHDKLTWTDEQWKEYSEAGNLRTWVAYYDGSPAGYFELDQQGDEVEIVYFGLAPAFIGKGLGGALLTHAMEAAWSMDPKRVWLHTCNLDHPAAIKNYQARGMVIYKTEVKEMRWQPELTQKTSPDHE